MNKFVGVSRYVLVVLCSFLLMASKSYAGWHDTTQLDRDNRIVAQAQHDLGLVGGQCIVWVRDVVRVASNQAGGSGVPVMLPHAVPYNGVPDEGYYWYSDPNVVSYGALDPAHMVPGEIIQMRIKYVSGGYGPHTAIVLANSPLTSTLTLIESNYYGDSVVRTRSVSYSAFLNAIEPTSHYTVYIIK